MRVCFEHRTPQILGLAAAIFLALWMAGITLPIKGGASASTVSVAYIDKGDVGTRDIFKTFLNGRGIDVHFVPLADVASADFSADRSIIVAWDTGSAPGDWAGSAAAVGKLAGSGKPIVGINLGGAALFGELGLAIGDPNVSAGYWNQVHVEKTSLPVFSTPNRISVPESRVLTLYNDSPFVLGVTAENVRQNGLFPLARYHWPWELTEYPLVAQLSNGVCRTLWGFASTPDNMTTVGKDLFVNVLLGEPCASTAPTLVSVYDPTPPEIDGAVGFREWENARQVTFDHGTITAVNDDKRLYLLVNVTGDTTKDQPAADPPFGDSVWLTFDVNGDGQISPGVDLDYLPLTGTNNLRYQYYLGQASWTEPVTLTKSSFAAGFGCTPGEGNCAKHRLWELAIDLREIGAQPGETVKMGLRSSSPNPAFTDNLPPDLTTSFADLIRISLAPPLTPFNPTPDPGATVRFAANPIEVTQAIQTITNSLPLVASKSTVARLYIDVDNAPRTQYATAYLYGARDGNDLPGSPLVQEQRAPTNVDRTRLQDTANFLLPRSWTAGAVQLQGRVVFSDTDLLSPPVNVSFASRRVPVYWIVPINSSVGSPTVPTDDEIAAQESYLAATYPVARVDFVRQSWQAVGVVAIPPNNLNSVIAALNSYASQVQAAWSLSVQATGVPPYDLPEQIYGFTASGGGLSDPVWGGGAGLVATGYQGTSLEGTMAHEIQHNLDTSISGTFGLHAPGCLAPGPNPAWPWPAEFATYGSIHEVGFDTRRTWSTGDDGRDTVIPITYPDFMTYCQSGRDPTKWISSYRWQSLFNVLGPSSLSPAASVQAIENVYYVSGQLNADGTGRLDPLLVQPGIPTLGVAPGEYAIEIQDISNASLLSRTFTAEFTDVEGEPRSTVYFSFRLPEQPGAARVVLKRGNQTLGLLVRSSQPPTVTVVSPNGSENWSGQQTVRWNAFDSDGDPLIFSVLYTPDGGTSWFPVATALTGTTYAVDTANLPPGSQAKMRVVASDGFNTVQDDSDGTFTVASGPPSVRISSPVGGLRFPSGTSIFFEGDAYDTRLARVVAETAYLWSFRTIVTADGQVTSTAPITMGTGMQISAALPDGTHEIALRVDDGRGNTGERKVFVSLGNFLHRVFVPLVLRNYP